MPRLTGLCLLFLALSCRLFAGGPSVYRLYPLTDAILIGAVGGGASLAFAFDRQLVTRRCPCDPAEVWGPDRGVIGNENLDMNLMADIMMGVAMGAPPLLDWMDQGFSQVLFEDLVVFTETIAVNAALATLVKFTVQRPIPRAYAGELVIEDKPSGFTSFYSGHTATAFAAMTAASMTYHYRYGFSPWPWLLTAGVGGLVGYGAIADGRHFYSDVAVGTLTGTAIGFLVPYLHRKSPDVALVPRPGGLELVWNAPF